MSLMQLLTVGHTLESGKDEAPPYRLARNWMPRFGGKNSVAPTRAPKGAAKTGWLFGFLTRRDGTPAPGEKDRATSPVKDSPRSGKEIVSGMRTRSKAERQKLRWVGFRWFCSKGAARADKPSLESVRVVRNELTDSDYEVVRADERKDMFRPARPVVVDSSKNRVIPEIMRCPEDKRDDAVLVHGGK
ncbi:MAG: hypothetical protein K9N48_02480 [Verrucomicrobia bacterium]|nr:hypothetical protein [Verrucomicrobiota bacterium]MCF7708863.1 hypothetical protein [Verrucomicrobiota bacterium]